MRILTERLGESQVGDAEMPMIHSNDSAGNVTEMCQHGHDFDEIVYFFCHFPHSSSSSYYHIIVLDPHNHIQIKYSMSE